MIETGERFPIEIEFYGSDYLPTDPIQPVELYLEAPDGAEIGPLQMSEKRTGLFIRRLSLPDPGTYRPWVEWGGRNDFVEKKGTIEVVERP